MVNVCFSTKLRNCLTQKFQKKGHCDFWRVIFCGVDSVALRMLDGLSPRDWVKVVDRQNCKFSLNTIRSGAESLGVFMDLNEKNTRTVFFSTAVISW